MEISWKQYAALLATYLKTQVGRIVILGLVLSAGIGLQLANPQILRGFIDTARAGGSISSLASSAWLFLSFSVLSQICTAYSAYLGADIGWVATNKLRVDLASHCLNLDMPFHNQHTPGEIIERVDGDVNALTNFFSQFLVSIVSNSLMLLGVLVLLFREDWRIGLVLALLAIASGVTLFSLRNYAVPTLKAEREANAQMMGFVEERVGGLEDIRANGMGPFTMWSFARVIRRLYETAVRAWVTRNVIWFLTTTLFILGNVVALCMGAYLFKHKLVTLGTVYLFFQYNTMLRNPIEQLARQIQDLQQASASILRIRELMSAKPTIIDGSGHSMPSGPLAVEFDQVSFDYHDGDPVLRDLSFNLAPGRVLGILGRTGSGKTTMMRLLFRLYDIRSGEVRLAGTDIRSLKIGDLRKRIGMVTQDVQLFHATVRDNLTFFNPEIPDERIMRVITELGLQEWFDRLPDGLDTQLHAGGAGLSAGESQLLAFTRVFLEDPGLVLLDEPSSRLDPATERLIERAVDKLLSNRTCMIIAHRLGTVRRADEILILDDGRILEHGERDALAEDPNSRFHHLLLTGMEKELA